MGLPFFFGHLGREAMWIVRGRHAELSERIAGAFI